MGLRATFNIKSIQKYQNQQELIRYESILNSFIIAGDEFCSDARNKTPTEGGFRDFTGNLRSSIGYVILYNGKQVAINFTYSKKGTDRETGLQTGIVLSELIAKEYKKGFVIVCVAGMEYALSVEAHFKDVITEASLSLSKNIKSLLSGI